MGDGQIGVSGRFVKVLVDWEVNTESGLAPIHDQCTEATFVMGLQRRSEVVTQGGHAKVCNLIFFYCFSKDFVFTVWNNLMNSL